MQEGGTFTRGGGGGMGLMGGPINAPMNVTINAPGGDPRRITNEIERKFAKNIERATQGLAVAEQ